ncbi:hypothetical protein SLA2020_077710 [Shorea laevis]
MKFKVVWFSIFLIFVCARVNVVQASTRLSVFVKLNQDLQPRQYVTITGNVTKTAIHLVKIGFQVGFFNPFQLLPSQLRLIGASEMRSAKISAMKRWNAYIFLSLILQDATMTAIQLVATVT